jgi:hypothetical protein
MYFMSWDVVWNCFSLIAVIIKFFLSWIWFKLSKLEAENLIFEPVLCYSQLTVAQESQ